MGAVADETAFLWYVFGVVRATGPAGPRDSVERIEVGRVAALVSRVSAADFGEHALPERLDDPLWLEGSIRGHEQVLEEVLQTVTVVPFRFCTLYRDEAQLRAFLAEHESDLAVLLERLEGKIELGVKAFVDADRLRRALGSGTAEARELEQEAAQAEPGRAYLLRRQRERLVADAVERAKADCLADSDSRLRAASEDARLNRPQPRELSGREDEMLLNGAYLVPAGDRLLEEAVARLATDHGSHGVSFELTGPWPPYNFVDLDAETQ